MPALLLIFLLIFASEGPDKALDWAHDVAVGTFIIAALLGLSIGVYMIVT